MYLFDSHAHYDDGRFESEFEGGGHGAIMKAHDEGVAVIVNVGASMRGCENSVKLAEKYDFVYAAVGIHPSDGQDIGTEALSETIEKLRHLADHPKVMAIGEIGLDYHYDDTERDCQMEFFHSQLCLAESVGKPVVIHSRDAMGDTLEVLSAHPNVTGVMHSFSGSAEVARQLVKAGWYISFSGPVTYKNTGKLREAAAAIPDDRILIETDCPYLPPVPHRGELNYSGYMKYTCEAIAEIRGVSTEEIARLTFENSCRLFGLDFSKLQNAVK